MPRPQHDHLFQADEPASGCPACALIRPEVMHRVPFHLLAAGAFGPPPTPETVQ